MSKPEHTFTRRTALAAMCSAVGSLVGCGGADSLAGLSSGGTGSFTNGTVTGLGSIIVNGVRFDIARATLSRNDAGAVSELLPGMVVSVEASEVVAPSSTAALPSASAVQVSYGSEWLGPVEQIGASTIAVLGNTVDVLGATVFSGGALRAHWSELKPGDHVEVFGYLDAATSRLQATRIEYVDRTPAHYRMSGAVERLDSTGQNFRIGGVGVAFGHPNATPLPFAPGEQVSVQLSTTPEPNGGWLATNIERRRSPAEHLNVNASGRASVFGTVTSVTTSSFSVNGLPVLTTGPANQVALEIGMFVEVSGTLAAGQLRATQVRIRDRASISAEPFLFFGQISRLVLDAAGGSFVLAGIKFVFTTGTRVDVPGLVEGATPSVRVRAVLTAGQWTATEILQMA